MDEEKKELEMVPDEGKSPQTVSTVKSTEKSAKEEPVFDLGRYDTKSWFKSFFLGAFIGLAIVVPGISGSAVAIIFRLYDKLIYAFANILKRFRACFLFLLPIAIGAILGFAIGFVLVKLLLDYIPFGLVGFFAGLMVGALPTVLEELKGDKVTTGKGILMAVGILIPLVIGAISVSMSFADGSYDLVYGLQEETSGGTSYIERFGDFPWWIYVVAIPIGLFLGFSQVIPGLSATAFLMLIGFFRPLVDSVSLTYWTTYPQIFAFYVLMGISLIAGFILTSKLMTKLFAWNRLLVFRVIVGMSIGSIAAMFLNPDSLGIYLSWAQGINTRMIVDFALFLPLCVGGFFSSNLLIRYGKKER